MERLKKFYWKVVTIQLDGINIIEIILILVIIIGLVLIFRTQITDIITSAFSSITSDSSEINTEITIQ
jgi:hypothetical protein